MSNVQGVSCRPLLLKDVRHVRMLMNRTEEFLTGIDDDAWSMEELATWVQSRDSVCVGAELGGEIVGVCLLVVCPYVAKAYLENIVVAQGQRRRGIGRQLLAYAMDLLNSRRSKRYRVVAMCAPDSMPAGAFFRECGFGEGLLFRWFQCDSGQVPEAKEGLPPVPPDNSPRA